MLDPSEVAVIVIWGSFLLLQILATGFLVLNRNYGPLRAKQIDLIVFSVISECFWFLGLLPTLKFWPLTGIWANCALWQLWFNETFGLFLWGGILQLRFVKLYMYEKKVFWPNWKMNLLLLLFWLPAWILAIVGSAIPDKIFFVDANNQGCLMANSFFGGSLAYAISYVISYSVFLVLLRKVKHRALNEYKGNLASVVVLVICFIIFAGLVYFDIPYQYLWGRCLAFSTLQFLHNFSFWVLLGYPLYLTLKDRVGYENYFYGRDETGESSRVNVLTTASP